jgi:magnesium chelatase subunit H
MAVTDALYACTAAGTVKAMAPCPERIDALVEKTRNLAVLRRKENSEKNVGIVLFGFPPNAGAIGTAAYLSVFESLHNTLQTMAENGYDVTPPETVDDLREVILQGNASIYGQEANVAAKVSADYIVTHTPWLNEIEEIWGPCARAHSVQWQRPFHSRCSIWKSFCRRTANLWL